MSRSRQARGEPSPLVKPVLAGVFVSGVGTGLTLPFLVVYLHEARHASILAATLVVAAMSAAALVLTPVGGTLVDRRGPWTVLSTALIVAALGSLGIALATSAATAVVPAAAMATGWSIAWAAETVVLARLAGTMPTERLFGVWFMVLTTGIGVGSLVAGLVVTSAETVMFQLLYLGDALSFLCYAVLIMALSRRPAARVADAPSDPNGAPDRGAWKAVLADRRFVVVMCVAGLLLMCSFGQSETGFPAFATQTLGVQPSVVAWAYAANTLTILAGQLVVLRLIVGRSSLLMLAGAGVVVAAAWALLGVGASGGRVVALVVGSMIVYGIAEAVINPVLPALVNALASNERRGRYNSVPALLFSLAAVSGPLLTAVTIGTGHPGAWLLTVVAGSLTASALFVVLSRRQ
ncbi:MAG: MFS transporter [Actinomycetes bacterium]